MEAANSGGGGSCGAEVVASGSVLGAVCRGVSEAGVRAAEGDASWPVACIIDPFCRDSMSVDCTPGREVRWDN